MEIREKRGLAYAVKSVIDAEKEHSHYLVYAGTTKEKVDEVKKIIIEEFRNVEKMSEKDLEEAKERVIGLKRVNSEESSGVITELMMEELNGDAENYYKHEQKIREVTLEQVKKLARIKGFSSAAIVPK